jgi:hypothetical protein
MSEVFESNGLSAFIDFNELNFDVETDKIGKGGYGEVYKGTWEGAPVAIKKFVRSMNRKAFRDFFKEIEVINQLRHPNII